MKLTTLKSSLNTIKPTLQVIAPNSWRAGKQSSTQRGYSYKWQQARVGYLAKHPYCKYCLRNAGISYDQDAVAIGIQCVDKGIGLPFASVVDHEIPHRGDMVLFWDSSNWQSLCAPCHDSVKKREESQA